MKDGQHVYVIEREPGYCKIGVSDNFERRKKQIEMQGGFKASNSYVTDGLNNAFEIENTVHKQFAEFRKIGEWFSVPFEKAVSAVAQTAQAIGRPWTEYHPAPEITVNVLSEQEKTVTERLNELVGVLNDRGRERLLDIAKGYEMCLRDNQLDRPNDAAPRPAQ